MPYFIRFIFTLLVIYGFTPKLIPAQTVDEIYRKFVKRYHTYKAITLPYHIFVPENYDPQQIYPLVLCLHGAGEMGDDSLAVKKNSMATVWARDSIQTRWPNFILVPQCPRYWSWMSTDILLTVNDLLDSLLGVFSVDTNRIYITGLSMGGNGTWGYIAYSPHKYAAAVPVCGWGDTLQAETIKPIPIWAFHGALDGVVPVSSTRTMISALEKAGLTAVYTDCKQGDCTGLPDSILAAEINNGATLLYTEYETGGHSIWDQAYNDPFLLPWVFAQIKTNQPAAVNQENITRSSGGFNLAQNYPNPFNSSTTIKFQTPNPNFVTLKVYNLLGQKVTTLVNENLNTGIHTVIWNATDFASGVYLFCLQAGNHVETKKLILLR
jgi:predicted esterase